MGLRPGKSRHGTSEESPIDLDHTYLPCIIMFRFAISHIVLGQSASQTGASQVRNVAKEALRRKLSQVAGTRLELVTCGL